MNFLQTLKQTGKETSGQSRKQVFTGIVKDNADPEGMQKVRVVCEPLYGEALSPWCICDTIYGGDGFGLVITPQLDDKISISIVGGDVSVPRYSTSPRVEGNAPPLDFADPLINGIKTPSGILILWDDTDGSVKIKNGDTSYIQLLGDNTIKIIGTLIETDGVTKLNKGSIPIALGGPTIKCPVTGADIPYSLSCFVSED